MARIFNCLLFRSVDLQTDNIYFDLVIGYAEPAEVVGQDDTVPGAAGMDFGEWTKSRRRILLEGYVQGTGETVQDRQQSWREQTDALMATLDRTAAPGVLEVLGPYLGLPDGEGGTLNARCLNVIPGPVRATMSFRHWSIELVCIDSPPEWMHTSSSS